MHQPSHRRTSARSTRKFVFVGAGGGALPLLQKSGIKEAKGFGGFPVGGEFLRTGNPALTAAHQAKVYGQPPLGAPPMSVPHLDTRVINGKSWLLFGPFAGWSPKFLKQGKVTDLPFSVKPNNLASMLGVGAHRAGPGEVPGRPAACSARPTGSTRCANSRPSAVDSDWELDVAGQRVQVIRAQGRGWRAGVRHHGARRRRRQHRRPARRVARRVDRGARDARRDGALLRRPVRGLAAQAQGDGAVAGHRAVQRARAVRRGVGTGAPRCSSSTRQCHGRCPRPVDGSHRDGALPQAQLGQGSRRRDALRTAEAARRGVRRRAGHARTRNWTAATCSPRPGTSGWRSRRRGHLARCG